MKECGLSHNVKPAMFESRFLNCLEALDRQVAHRSSPKLLKKKVGLTVLLVWLGEESIYLGLIGVATFVMLRAGRSLIEVELSCHPKPPTTLD